jgi:hypothetical protein
MLQILLNKQFKSSCFKKFLCSEWKSVRLEKVKYDVIENLHIINKEESQRQETEDDIDRTRN